MKDVFREIARLKRIKYLIHTYNNIMIIAQKNMKNKSQKRGKKGDHIIDVIIYNTWLQGYDFEFSKTTYW